MISQPLTIIRTNKLGKPYVQDTDPSTDNNLSINDMWLNPSKGTFKTWNGTEWVEMQWGASAIMDDCIANRLLANDISANKITTGILQSQNGDFTLNLGTGEARLLNLTMGGQVEGNIIATSYNGRTRVRLRGREGDRDITAGLIFEQKEDTDNAEWENAGQIYFAYNTQNTYATFNNYEIGGYNSRRPTMGYNAGSADGLLWRMLSTDWLRAGLYTYHGARLQVRDSISNTFHDVSPVLNAVGNCLSGTSIVCDGIVTCTYQFNDIMRLDFNLKITTAGSTNASWGISRNLLRQLNSEIPLITPVDGGSLQIIGSNGNLFTNNIGVSLVANDSMWTPSKLVNGVETAFNESDFGANITLIGTCFGTYNFNEV